MTLLPDLPDRQATGAEVRGQAGGRGLEGVARLVGGHGGRLAESVDEVGPVAHLAPQPVQRLALPAWEVGLARVQIVRLSGDLPLVTTRPDSDSALRESYSSASNFTSAGGPVVGEQDTRRDPRPDSDP